MTFDESQSTTDTLTQILVEMNQEGNFLASVVTDQNGLPIVFAAQDGFDTDWQSAIMAMVKKVITQNEKRLGISNAEEISIVDSDGRLLVCRAFSARDYDLILAVLIANRQQTYRRITTRATNQISRVWSKRWK
jgi:predicted regulator of Ras-like GTPase activity (Roadblock/LC7/MglB family)